MAEANHTNRKRGVLETLQGVVTLVDWCSPSFIASHDMGPGLGDFPAYRSIFATPESLARVAAARGPSNLILGIDSVGRIVAYCALREPPDDDFWGRLGYGTLYEITALEVSKEYRNSKLGKKLLDMGLTEPVVDQRICYMVGYSWTWDLEGSGLTANEYRQILMNLLAPYNFKRYPTNEPNVSLRPENIFMARIGTQIPKDLEKKFKNLLFGIL